MVNKTYRSLLLAGVAALLFSAPAAAQNNIDSPFMQPETGGSGFAFENLPHGIVPLEPVKMPFIMMGDPAAKFSVAQGKYMDRLFWYYEPAIGPDGKGFIRVEITDGNHPRSSHVGFTVMYLDENSNEVMRFGVSWETHHMPGKAIAQFYDHPPEFWARIKTVVIMPSFIYDADPSQMTVYPVWPLPGPVMKYLGL